MEHLRTRWAALVVALFLLLSVAGVAGASNLVRLADENAPVVEDQVDDQGEDEDTDEDTTEDTDEDTTEDTDEDTTETTTETTDITTDSAQGEHGALVSAVAQNKACIGGPNENHGWAVSQVATGALIPDLVTGCPIAPVPVTTDATDTTDVAASPGKSGEHRQDKANKAKKAKHGRP